MKLFKKFWKIIEKKYQIFLISLIFLMILGAMLETLGVTLIIPIIGTVLAEEVFLPKFFLNAFPFLELATQKEIIIYVISSFIVFYIFKSFYLVFLVYIQAKFIYSIQRNISTRLYKTYLNQPYSFHLHKNSATIISNVMNESMQFAMSFTAPLVYFLTDILLIIGISSLLILIEPFGAIIILIIFSLGSLLMYVYSKERSSKWGEKRQEHEAKRIQAAQQGINGIKDIKLYGFESVFFKYFYTSTDISLTSGRLQTTLQGMPKIFFEFLTVIALSALILSLYFSDTASSDLIATIGVFAMSAFKLLPSIARLVTNIQAFRFGQPVIHIIEKELDLKAIPSKEVSVKKLNYKKNIVLDNINFLYTGSQNNTLKKINLTIKSDQTIGIIGSSGAGKSTLIDIILGLLKPTSGKILVDNELINDQNIRSWQKNIGYVSQSIYLLDDSFRKNIAFGLSEKEIDENKIQNSIKLAQLEELINSLPDGLDTFVGESGVRLSGGQRQRIGIARALYNNPSVLVLDEATSALDVRTELEVMKSIRSMYGQKTILIIAHRLSTVKFCDYIYNIDDGEIVGEGTPDEML
ncbi:MAG: ABC transporter ATP-binding protein [Pseudomonadota bacterium]|nr:ATPase [Gammaproteobacteria bacterium]MEE2684485.1 ABC transporter ATP-binding protein [Pseudomonadota bacterium]|tara:strand:+ start:4511 stop:6250 length:1740 start_codon:yes stop_codon:yes gene_type:complete